jgi:mono/diheme cytochrome c family protein
MLVLRQRIAVAIGTSLLISTGCSGNAQKSIAAQEAIASLPPKSASIANGRSIFHTGRDINGVRISAQRPPLRQSCEACHRPSGAGGVRLPDGAVSADLRYSSLVTGQKHPYTLALLERAISIGIDNEGKHLDPVMPRWKLSQRDLHDVAAYVLTQLK